MRQTKILWMLLGLPMLLALTSCTSDNDNPVNEPGANSELVGQWYSDVSGATYAAWTFGKAWQQTELKADGTGTNNIRQVQR